MKVSATALIMLVWLLNASGQPIPAKDYRAPIVFWVDWDCLKTNYPKAQLDRVVGKAVEDFGKRYVTTWGDRALAHDLNADGRSEYFIPLGCSPVGNCSWGVFALHPAKLIGIINAENIYVRRPVKKWSALTAYSHASAAEGVITSYAFRKGRYKKLPGGRNVSATPHLDSYLPGPLYPRPRFLGKIPSPCAARNAVRASPK